MAESSSSSSGVTGIVAIVAIVLLVAMAFFVFRGFGRRGDGQPNLKGNIEIKTTPGPSSAPSPSR
jgi:hypothetical protein